MGIQRGWIVAYAGICVIAIVCGCSSKSKVLPPVTPPTEAPPSDPSVGPHGGRLMEAVPEPNSWFPPAPEKFLVEVVHDEGARVLTAYLLDSATRQPITTFSGSIALRAMVNHQPLVYAVVASPLESDPPPRASRFITKKKDHLEAFTDAGTKPFFQIVVDSVAYTAKIEPEEGSP